MEDGVVIYLYMALFLKKIERTDPLSQFFKLDSWDHLFTNCSFDVDVHGCLLGTHTPGNKPLRSADGDTLALTVIPSPQESKKNARPWQWQGKGQEGRGG